MTESDDHPQLKQFRAALRDGTAAGPKANNFRRWLDNPKKVEPGSSLHEAASALWREYEASASEGQHSAPTRQRVSTVGRPNQFGDRGGSGPRGRGGSQAQPEARRNAAAASPEVFGAPFHNPYTFLPFPDRPPTRRAPTPLTIDEREPERRSGVLDLELETMSPLLTCSPVGEGGSVEGERHRKYPVLRVGDDVIVPATGVRGALRSMMSIVVGGTLSYVDEAAWLVQGRDVNLGPRHPEKGRAGTPENYFLARVVRSGDAQRDGVVELGDTKLVSSEHLRAAIERAGFRDIEKELRPTSGRAKRTVWVDGKELSDVSSSPSPRTPWQVKLSGRRINTKGEQREGIFLGSGWRLTLPASLWAAYLGRHAHGAVGELREGDLVWLEPAQPDLDRVRSAEDVRSIQWARWGRRGSRLLDVIIEHHSHLLPDAFNPDGLVDEVTDLFGQVPAADSSGPRNGPGPAGPFAARVRPENVVFEGAWPKQVERSVPLAPLLAPHPGCAAFYRDQDDADLVANDQATGLRGYKVYRTTSARGADAPWRYETQPVFGNDGLPRLPAQQKVNKSCDLLREGATGRLRIAFRALSRRELALLVAACTVDWRLGGGKPLGLGHCRVRELRAVDEFGEELVSLSRSGEELSPLPEALESELGRVRDRLRMWQASQRPVPLLRYPRAVERNKHSLSRGGHAWFKRHAEPQKRQEDYEGTVGRGLQTTPVAEKLCERAGKDLIRAQTLPRFDPGEPAADVLYGYDLIASKQPGSHRNDPWRITDVEPFDAKKHGTGRERSGGNQSQNRKTRRDGRRDSRGDGRSDAR